MDNLIWVEVRGWYDWIAYRLDKQTNQRYSTNAKIPIWENRLCKNGNIYTVEQVWEYEYRIVNMIEDWIA